MSLPENQFFEVQWSQHNKGDAGPVEWKGIVLDWAAPMGATSWTVIMREDMKVQTIQTDKLKVRGIIDMRLVPKDWGADDHDPLLPIRRIHIRGAE